MTLRQLVLLAAGGAALVVAGAWLGRSASAPAPAPAATVPAPRQVHTAARPSPVLATRVVTPGLAIDLRDPDPKVRRAAVGELARAGASDPEALLAASHDANLDVAVAATEGLGALYRDGRITTQDLAARITDHALPEKVRVTAMNGLGLVPSAEGAAMLVDLLAHGDAIDRRSAAILLVHQDPMTAVPALIGALGDADELVRSNAHDSLHAFARGRDFGLDAAAWQRWWQSRAI